MDYGRASGYYLNPAAHQRQCDANQSPFGQNDPHTPNGRFYNTPYDPVHDPSYNPPNNSPTRSFHNAPIYPSSYQPILPSNTGYGVAPHVHHSSYVPVQHMGSSLPFGQYQPTQYPPTYFPIMQEHGHEANAFFPSPTRLPMTSAMSQQHPNRPRWRQAEQQRHHAQPRMPVRNHNTPSGPSTINTPVRRQWHSGIGDNAARTTANNASHNGGSARVSEANTASIITSNTAYPGASGTTRSNLTRAGHSRGLSNISNESNTSTITSSDEEVENAQTSPRRRLLDQEYSLHFLRSNAEVMAAIQRYSAMPQKPKISEKVLKSLIPTTKDELEAAGEEIQCIICYNDFGVTNPEGVTEQPLRLPQCKHVFGDVCIRQWFEDNSTCPYCRDKLPVETVDRRALAMEHLIAFHAANGPGMLSQAQVRDTIAARAESGVRDGANPVEHSRRISRLPRTPTHIRNFDATRPTTAHVVSTSSTSQSRVRATVDGAFSSSGGGQTSLPQQPGPSSSVANGSSTPIEQNTYDYLNRSAAGQRIVQRSDATSHVRFSLPGNEVSQRDISITSFMPASPSVVPDNMSN